MLIQDQNTTFTQEEVLHVARRLSSALRDAQGTSADCKSGHPDKVVLLLLEQSGLSALTIAACWSAGIPFVALSHDADAVRLSSVLKSLPVALMSGHGSNIVSRGMMFRDKRLRDVPFLSTESLLKDVEDDGPGDRVKIETKATSESIAAYFFTSGTSGPVKTVPLTRSQIKTAARNMSELLPVHAGEQWLCPIPMHHIGGASTVFRAMESGFGVRIVSGSEIERISELMSTDEHVVAVSLVPTQLFRMLSRKEWGVHSRFRAVLLGGGPVSATLQSDCIERGIPVLSSFGMTETGAACVAVPLSNWSEAPAGCSGKPLGDLEIRIVPDDIEPDEGVLWIRGSQVFNGYLEDALNQNAFDQDGWFCTGDIVRMDSEGYLHVKMRRIDRIVTGGENVNPSDVESAVVQALGLTNIAVVGMPDSEWGQIIVLVVESDVDVPEVSDLKSALSSKIRSFEIPKRVISIDEIPKTASGKIKRHELMRVINLSG